MRHFTVVDDMHALGKSSITTNLVSASTVRLPLPLFLPSAETTPISPEPDAIFKQSCQVVYPSNFKQVPEEITPFSSKFLGTLSKLREWNDKFSKCKRMFWTVEREGILVEIRYAPCFTETFHG